MLTRKTTYGIRALTSLARAEEGSLSVAELAAREGIPEHFLSVILSDLRQRGIVRGRRGPDGGYQLSVDPRKLNLAEVVASLGGPLFPFVCLERRKDDSAARCAECPGRGRCPAEWALGRAGAAAYAALEAITVFDLVEDCDRALEAEERSESGTRPAVTPSGADPGAKTAPGRSR